MLFATVAPSILQVTALSIPLLADGTRNVNLRGKENYSGSVYCWNQIYGSGRGQDECDLDMKGHCWQMSLLNMEIQALRLKSWERDVFSQI